MNNSELTQLGKLLPLMEEFYSIQGEGYNTGKAAYFIRLGGCDIGCNFCDVKEGWRSENHKQTETDSIIKNITENKSGAVVITGGEPLNYNLDYLCNSLKGKNIKTFLETSGYGKLTGFWDWICFSPKKGFEPDVQLYKKANELKIIISDSSDFVWAEQMASKVNNECYLCLQPEWSKRKEITPEIINYILNNPKWNISIQTHKYLNIP